MGYTDFHSKYRPASLDALIGHDDAVTRLRGMVESEHIPGALLFTGPSSVGKTTLARAFAAEINGMPVEQQVGDYKELNAGDTRSIEDMRELIQLSKFRPVSKRRIFVIDEAQQIVTNAAAAAALLKPLEEASKETSKTTWILCSMDPSKFTSGNGKAIANRCIQFNLEPHTNSDLLKQATRIAKSEQMAYLEKDTLKEIVRAANSEMRTLANMMQGVHSYYLGLKDKPAVLDAAAIASVLQAGESSDDTLVVQVIVGALSGKYASVQTALLDVAEGFTFINKLLWCAQSLLNTAALGGARHPKAWPSASAKAVVAKLKSEQPTLGQLAALNECLVNLKITASSFSVDEMALVSARLYRFIKDNIK